jgi:ABC-type cobalamin/Fe3+-siderophores transport system ATPase subunit
LGTADLSALARVAVIGCSGSGKTTLARTLAAVLGAPHVELDSIYHQPNWTPLSDEEFKARVSDAVASDRWVVDGNYSAVQAVVWERADTVVWVDPGFARVMSQMVRRTLWRTITREELWNGNREPLSNLWRLDPEKSIIMWAATRHGLYRERYGAAMHDQRWAGLRFVRLGTQAEVDAFVAGVSRSGAVGKES